MSSTERHRRLFLNFEDPSSKLVFWRPNVYWDANCGLYTWPITHFGDLVIILKADWHDVRIECSVVEI